MKDSSKVSFNHATIGSGNNNGGGIYVAGGTVTIGTSSSHSASICNNTGSSRGGGIYIAGGTVNLYGSVKSNFCNNSCGGVEIENAGTIKTYSGSTIENNSTAAGGYTGQGVQLSHSDATLQMFGGSIKTNGSYDVGFTNGTVEMQGNVQAGNVFVNNKQIKISDALTSPTPAATIIPINNSSPNYSPTVTVLSDDNAGSLVAAACAKFAVADDADGNKWCVAADGYLCRLLQPDTSAVTIIDPAQPWVVTSSNSKEITLKLQNAFSPTFNVTLRNLNKPFESDCSALYIQNNVTSSSFPPLCMGVNLILEGDNTLIGSHHGGIQLRSNSYTDIILTFDTKTTATLTFDGKPGTDGGEPTSLCVESGGPIIGIASGLTFSGSIGNTTYTDATAFFTAARSTTQSCTFTITRP